MFPNNIEFFGHERHHERFQDVEHIRLVKIARPRQVSYREMIGKMTNWLGCQLVKLGTRLQSYDSTPLPDVSPMETMS